MPKFPILGSYCPQSKSADPCCMRSSLQEGLLSLCAVFGAKRKGGRDSGKKVSMPAF